MHRLLTAALVAGAVLVLVGPAGGRPIGSSGVITKKDPAGDVRAPGLTRAERNAIDITSVQIGGEEGLGLFGTVTFKGNFQQLAGRGHLKSVAAGLILRAKVGGTTTPAILLTAGPGKGTVYRKTRSTTVSVIRDDQKLDFFVIGPGFDSVGSVQAKVLTDFHPLPPSTILDVPLASIFLNTVGADASTVLPAYGTLTCPQLLELVRMHPGFSPAAEGLQNEYHDRCETPPATGSYSLTFGNPPVCFVNNGQSTDARFENLIIRLTRAYAGTLPPASGTLELKSTSGFDQTTPVAFDSSGKAAPVKFNLTSFGDYTANAVASVSGQTVQASTTFSLNKANDVTTC